jgi:rhomboid protease GluP
MNEQSQARELLSFQIFYSTRQIKATWALALVIALMFFLEEIFGGSTTISTLIKMGANDKELVREGQYYRLLTSVFLHAGYLHVIVNTYVLFALGGFFNRILGDSKFLTLFLFSGICGSISSTLLGGASVSVGAQVLSGASLGPA